VIHPLSRPRASVARGAFSLVELIIALAISVALLTATAIAIDAMTRSMNVNIASADATAKARIALNRMLQDIRSGTNHQANNATLQTSFAGGTTVTDTGIRFTAENGTAVTYRYNATARTIELVTGAALPVVLARNIDSFNIQMRPTRSDRSVRIGGTFDLLDRCVISMQLRTTVTLPLTGSVTPRRQIWD
jgi:Tfp pilus assembly protein PilW